MELYVCSACAKPCNVVTVTDYEIKLMKKVNEVTEQLKERERLSWSTAVIKKVKESGEEYSDFFRIIYKLSVLERMKDYLKKYHNLSNSFRWMLRNPLKTWGNRMFENKRSNYYLPPDQKAERKKL